MEMAGLLRRERWGFCLVPADIRGWERPSGTCPASRLSHPRGCPLSLMENNVLHAHRTSIRARMQPSSWQAVLTARRLGGNARRAPASGVLPVEARRRRAGLPARLGYGLPALEPHRGGCVRGAWVGRPGLDAPDGPQPLGGPLPARALGAQRAPAPHPVAKLGLPTRPAPRAEPPDARRAPATTSSGAVLPFLVGCHSAAREGCASRSGGRPAQIGQPSPRTARENTVASQEWPHAPSHQTGRKEPARTRSGARSPFFSGCHSAATDGHAVARSLRPGIGSSPMPPPSSRGAFRLQGLASGRRWRHAG